MSVSQILRHLYSLDEASPEFLRALYKFTRLDEDGEYSFNLQQPESARLVDFLDGALDSIPVTDALFRRCLRRLRQVCSQHNILPSSHTISDGLRTTSEHAVAYGGFADVWEGTLGSDKVCIKMLRIYNGNTNTQKRPLAPFYGEAVVWKRLRHPNVVPFLGVTTTPLQLVSRWMPNGTLTEYVSANPQADRISLLLDVAEGLNYLHTCHTVHGDLKGPNILIDGPGHARVCDFGLASIAHGKYTPGLKSDKGHSARWSAPEILFGECTTSKQADIFAFAMVVIEAFTGKVPFHTIVSSAVTWKLMNGERPPRPNEARELGLTDSVWRMTECCWLRPPKERLKTSEVVDLLREMYALPPNSNYSRVGEVGGTARSAGSTIPQTDAALSPRLLEILQYRESTHKRTLSDNTPLNDDRRTAVGSLLERPTSAPIVLTTRQQPTTGGIIQRLGAMGQVPQGPPPSSPSNSVSTSGNDSWHTTESTLQELPRSNPSPKLVDGTGNTPESKGGIPIISVHGDDYAPSEDSSLTIVDGSESQRHLPANFGAPRGAGSAGNSRGVDDAGNGRGVHDPRGNRGENDVRKVSGSNQPGPQQSEPRGQQPSRPPRLARTYDHDHPALPPFKTVGHDSPAVRDLKPFEVESTASRNSITRRSGTGLLAATGTGDEGSKPSTRPASPASEPRGPERGGEPRPADIHRQQAGTPKKGFSGWGRVRVMAKVLGLNKGHNPQSKGPGE